MKPVIALLLLLLVIALTLAIYAFKQSRSSSELANTAQENEQAALQALAKEERLADEATKSISSPNQFQT